ncbi:MAG: NRDE family protein [Brevundimonas sp.]|nr:NRDE family protein [Brevundimonas sp.]
MCVLTLAWDIHPDWLLIAAGNRDEAHARPSAPLARWSDGSGLIGGRDLLSGGMWLGVSEHHPRFAVVTNVTGQGPPDPDRLSRGGLVRNALASRTPFAAAQPSRYNPFNLIVVADGEARESTNRPEALDRPLARGWHALSNGLLGAPWDRKERLTLAAQAWLETAPTGPEGLFGPLDDRVEGRPAELARPIFLLNDLYGTRCSTVVAVDRAGRGRIWERRFDATGALTGETEIAFHWLI